MTTVVAIDGPSGSGKSTTARAVAARLGLPVLDTGAMYRAVTLAVLEAGIDPADESAVAGVVDAVALAVEGATTLLDDRDVSEAIRGPEVTTAVSVVSAHPVVRHRLVARQRAWVDEHGGGVVEGRDIGTVVFPDATVKVFLVAGEDVRAHRRHEEDVAARRGGGIEEVRAELARRDGLDRARVASPLRAAEDAFVIDTTSRSVDEVVAEVLDRLPADRP